MAVQQNKNAPCPWTEGDKLSRYHLMFAASSRKTASSGADTPYRCNGRTRHIPTDLEVQAFRRLLRDVFARAALSSFHQPEVLFAGAGACYFFPSSR